MGSIVTKLIQNYKDGQEDKLQEGWDYVQAQVRWGGRVSACLGLGVCVSDEIMLASLYVSVYLMGAGTPEHPPTWDPSRHQSSSLRGPGCWRLPHGPQRSRLWWGGGGVSSRSSHFKPGRLVLGAPPWKCRNWAPGLIC